jgi:hypothetical protein
MSETIHEKIEREVAALWPSPPRARVGQVLLAEGRHAAKFAEDHYAPVGEGGKRLPGLADANLPATIAAEMRSLIDALEGNNMEGYGAAAPSPFPLARVKEVITALGRSIGWLAVDDPALAARLRDLRRAHRGAKGAPAWAGALAEHLRLARAEEERLRALPAFRVALFDEAEALLRAQREAPPSDDTWRLRRVALGALLRQRIRRVVAAADFVFGPRSPIAREARSERLRRQQTAAGRARREHRPEPDAPTPTAPTA